VASEQLVLVARGRADGRLIVIVPETKGGETTGITLLHVRFTERMQASAMRSVLSSYRNRFAALADSVTETEPSFDESLLAEMQVVDLLTDPIQSLAERWRTGRLQPR